MKLIDTHGNFADVIRESSADVQKIAQSAHDLILEIYEAVYVVPWPHQGTVGFGVGPKKMTEHFAYIGVFTKHVNLGFNYGANLADPKRLLDGTGKMFRKISLKKPDELLQSGVRELIQAAIAEREKALA
jgi:hypothetical protein